MQETLKKNSEIKDEKIQALETRYSVFITLPHNSAVVCLYHL